jgi:hypothetical protein
MQSACACWTRHCAALEASEQSLTERLAACRAEHDSKRQDLETETSTRIDQLRQAATTQTIVILRAQV